MVKPKRVGHIVLNVSNVAESVKFYKDILGFEMARDYKGNAFLTSGKIHHDLALFQAKPDAAPVTPGGLGLNHMALQMEDWDALVEIYHRVLENGVELQRTQNHGMTLSVYVYDPDHNLIELFCNGQEKPEDGLERMYTQESLGWDLDINSPTMPATLPV